MIQDLAGINLYSDTQTLPTDRMREAMKQAVVGDDVNGADPTVNRLEAMGAARVGKEAAVFVPSGHMGNLIATMVHCARGDEVILEETCHMYYYEAGSIAAVAGVMPHLVSGQNGIFGQDQLHAGLRAPNLHYPPTRLVCVENTHNRGGGSVWPLEALQEIAALSARHQLVVHMDGARVFNAATALGVDVREITANADSVSFCLSKALSAPVGSLLAGTESFIAEARRIRKLLGGGMRQVVIAAAGIIALEEMTDRLEEDHEHARLLAEGLSAIPGHQIDLETVQTNIVRADIGQTGLSTAQYLERLAAHQITASGLPPTGVRFVTHRHIERQDIEKVLGVARTVI